MTSDIQHAFAHPELRSIETAADLFLDRISVRDHVVNVEIGAFQVERGMTQRISFDIVVEVRPSSGAATDDVDDILSYDRVTEAITAELAHERLSLLETLAERVAARILTEPPAERVFVRIEKLDRGVSKLGVEIVRTKGEVTRISTDKGGALAAVIHVPTMDVLRMRLPEVFNLNCPIVLTVLNSNPESELVDPIAALRIDLLSIEQTAWQFSSLHPNLVVVDTWTELDWGIKNGQISIWAPSKMVLDTADTSIADSANALELSIWLAKALSAQSHVVLDEKTDLTSLGV